MSNTLTLCYVTFRRNPKFEWWADSLIRQVAGTQYPRPKVVVIAFDPTAIDQDALWRVKNAGMDVQVSEPMPSVWQGKHRLTKADYFDVACARNAGICLADTSHLCFCDDLSVLMPGWYEQVTACLRDSVLGGKVVCGAYQKVNQLTVACGEVRSFQVLPPGLDHRIGLVAGNEPSPCRGQWAFGCSLLAPVEAFLSVNGYDQDTSGMGYEDVVLGQMLEQSGWEFVFAPRMMTWESEELHHDPSNPRFLRSDPGQSPNDKSHAILNLVKGGRRYAPNYYGEAGLRGLRSRVLAGEPFPVIQVPQHEWFSGVQLSSLPNP